MINSIAKIVLSLIRCFVVQSASKMLLEVFAMADHRFSDKYQTITRGIQQLADESQKSLELSVEPMSSLVVRDTPSASSSNSPFIAFCKVETLRHNLFILTYSIQCVYRKLQLLFHHAGSPVYFNSSRFDAACSRSNT